MSDADALTSPPANVIAWQSYAAERLTAELGQPHHHAPPAELHWGQTPGAGPGSEILGDLLGRRVLELGCGAGDTSAYLAQAGADVTGIDAAPAQIERARRRWHHPNLRFVTADASVFLQMSPSFDIVISVFGAPDFTPPTELLPLIAARLCPAGLLAFSTLHPGHLTNRQARPRLRSPSGRTIPVRRYVTDPEAWPSLLRPAGLHDTGIREIPAADGGPGCVLVTARPTRR